MPDPIHHHRNLPASQPIESNPLGGPTGLNRNTPAGDFKLEPANATRASTSRSAPTFDGISQRIAARQAQGLDRQQTLQLIVREELKAAFGATVPDAMVARVADSVQANQDMNRLFTRLCQLASRGPDSGRMGGAGRINL